MDSYVELGGTVNGFFTRNHMVKKADKKEAISSFNFKDVYSTIYEYDSPNIDTANILSPVYLDIDAKHLEKDYELIKRDVLFLVTRLKKMFSLKDENFEIYFSGSKGFHIIIPHTVFGFEFSKDLNKKLKSLAIELQNYTITKSVDTRIYDNKRLFRESNTINSKTGLYKVPLILNDLRNFNYEDILSYANSPKKVNKVDSKFNGAASTAFNKFIEEVKLKQKRIINTKKATEMMKNKVILPCIAYILQNGAPAGSRNNTAMALASGLFQREGDKYEEVLDVMSQWNNKLDEPISSNELTATVKSAYGNLRNNRRYGCSAFMDLGVCIKGCPIKK